MNFQQRLRSWRLRALINPWRLRSQRWLAEKRRRLTGAAHVVQVFLQIDDPYSYLLSCYLPSLLSHYDIELRLHLSEARGGPYQPAAGMLAEYSLSDCRKLAEELGLPFLDIGCSPPSEHRIALTDAVAARAGEDDFTTELHQALEIFWRGDSEAASRRCDLAGLDGKAARLIAESQAIEKKLGHYNSAMLYYGGEWYWGVDRLHYLTTRLDELGVAKANKRQPRLAAIQQAMHVSLPVTPPAAAKALGPIELFHSLRSPYSYLMLRRVREVAEAFGMELTIRPVLPMVMRGMQVPTPKLRYIALDTAREAIACNIPFGRLADPVGVGIERCLAVFHYARTQNRDFDFLLHAGNAIWADRIDVATDTGMRNVTERVGLSWSDVRLAMSGDAWRESIDANRETMLSAGSWGVPTVRLGDFVVWGQDRLWLLVRHIEDLCADEDGVLV